MKIAIDIDGTLTAFPELFKLIMVALKTAGHYVCFLTGTLGDVNILISHDKEMDTGYLKKLCKETLDGRIEQLESYGVISDMYNELIVACGKTVTDVAELKGAFCKQEKIDVVFEDTKLFTDSIGCVAPETTCFLIQNKG